KGERHTKTMETAVRRIGAVACTLALVSCLASITNAQDQSANTATTPSSIPKPTETVAAVAAPAQTPAGAPTPQNQAPTPAAPASPAPTALPTPAITGPLQGIPPATFDGGPFGKLSVNGIVSGFGMWQGNHVPGDNPTQANLSNGQIFLQKADGWWQF